MGGQDGQAEVWVDMQAWRVRSVGVLVQMFDNILLCCQCSAATSVVVACRRPVNRQYSQQQQPVQPAQQMQDHTLCWHQHLCEYNTTGAYQSKESQIHSTIMHTCNAGFWCLHHQKKC